MKSKKETKRLNDFKPTEYLFFNLNKKQILSIGHGWFSWHNQWPPVHLRMFMFICLGALAWIREVWDWERLNVGVKSNAEPLPFLDWHLIAMGTSGLSVTAPLRAFSRPVALTETKEFLTEPYHCHFPQLFGPHPLCRCSPPPKEIPSPPHNQMLPDIQTH